MRFLIYNQMVYQYQPQPAVIVSDEDDGKVNKINDVCIGYSSKTNWSFFDTVLSNPEIKNICIFGVYYGRDIAYFSSILAKYNREAFITGVDKFKDEFGEDWPEEKRNKSWEQAGFGRAPAVQSAFNNLCSLNTRNFELVEDTAQHYLEVTEKKFDFIYIDVSHDYKTTMEVIKLSIPKLTDVGIIGGDDYQDEGTAWVKSAVTDSFENHQVHHNWFWLTNKQEFKL